MCITYVEPELKRKIKSIVVREFKGIDHLPDMAIDLQNEWEHAYRYAEWGQILIASYTDILNRDKKEVNKNIIHYPVNPETFNGKSHDWIATIKKKNCTNMSYLYYDSKKAIVRRMIAWIPASVWL